MGGDYIHPGGGRDPGPNGQGPNRRIDRHLLYATCEEMRDKRWASHDKMMNDLKAGRINLDPNRPLPSTSTRKPKVLERLHHLPDRCWTVVPNETRGCQYYTKALTGL